MNNHQFKCLKAYFEEFETYPEIETVTFCETRSDNIMLAHLLRSGDIELVSESTELIPGSTRHRHPANIYRLTDEGEATYEFLDVE